MNIEKLQQLSWYVKPFLRIFGLLLWFFATFFIGIIMIIFYVPCAILFGWNWSNKLAGFGSDIMSIAEELTFL